MNRRKFGLCVGGAIFMLLTKLEEIPIGSIWAHKKCDNFKYKVLGNKRKPHFLTEPMLPVEVIENGSYPDRGLKPHTRTWFKPEELKKMFREIKC